MRKTAKRLKNFENRLKTANNNEFDRKSRKISRAKKLMIKDSITKTAVAKKRVRITT